MFPVKQNSRGKGYGAELVQLIYREKSNTCYQAAIFCLVEFQKLTYLTSDFFHCSRPHLPSICCAHVPNLMTQHHMHILSECIHFQNLSRCLKLNFNVEKDKKKKRKQKQKLKEKEKEKNNGNNNQKKKQQQQQKTKTKQNMLMQLKKSTYRRLDSSLYSWENSTIYAIGYSVCRDVLGRF